MGIVQEDMKELTLRLDFMLQLFYNILWLTTKDEEVVIERMHNMLEHCHTAVLLYCRQCVVVPELLGYCLA